MGSATALDPTAADAPDAEVASESAVAPAPPRPSTSPRTVSPRTISPRTLERLGLAAGVLIVLAYAAWSIASRSLWLDESYTVAAIHHPRLSLSRTSGTMGFYYVLMWVWGQVGLAAWWLRLPSVLFALGSLVVTGSIARRIGGPRYAACAIPLLALQPMFELKATEARSYSLMTLLVAISWALALRIFDDGRARWWVLLAVVSLAGVMSHGLFVVHLAPILVVAAMSVRGVRASAAVLPAVGVAAGVAWLLRNNGADTIGTFVHGGPLAWLVSTLQAFVDGPPLAQLVVIVGLVVGVRTVGHEIAAAATRERRAAWVVPLAWTVGPVIALGVMSLAIPRFNPRYLAPITPGIALLLAAGIKGLPALVHPAKESAARLVRPVAAAVVAGALLVAVSQAHGPREEWREAAEVVAGSAAAGDALLFANLSYAEPEQHRPPFEVAWDELALGTGPTVVSSPRDLGRARRYEDGIRTPAAMADDARAHPRVWVVGGSSGGSVEIDGLLADPGFDGLELTDRWAIPDGIEVRLYTWQP